MDNNSINLKENLSKINKEEITTLKEKSKKARKQQITFGGWSGGPWADLKGRSARWRVIGKRDSNSFGADGALPG